jgi:DNA-binding response OmpR family regulator
MPCSFCGRPKGGPLTLDDEFFVVHAGDFSAALSEREFYLIKALLRCGNRAAYSDWLCESIDLKRTKTSLSQVIGRINRKFNALGWRVEWTRGAREDGGGYRLTGGAR